MRFKYLPVSRECVTIIALLSFDNELVSAGVLADRGDSRAGETRLNFTVRAASISVSLGRKTAVIALLNRGQDAVLADRLALIRTGGGVEIALPSDLDVAVLVAAISVHSVEVVALVAGEIKTIPAYLRAGVGACGTSTGTDPALLGLAVEAAVPWVVVPVVAIIR